MVYSQTPWFVSIAYLALLEEPEIIQLVLDEYKAATNMTDQFAALSAISQIPGQARDEVLSDFYEKWQHDFLVCFFWCALFSFSCIELAWQKARCLVLFFRVGGGEPSTFIKWRGYLCILFVAQVVNKWFALQAYSDIPGNVHNVKKLLNHIAFDLRNPNKVCTPSLLILLCLYLFLQNIFFLFRYTPS